MAGDSSAAAARSAAPSLAFQPALDGLRALCLIAVLLFHSGFVWMSGGFLGVSTFFTLSGYLITSLLLVEYEATGHVSFAAFWRRRLRRLMPAALIGIAVVTLSSPLWLTPDERDRLAGDALAALAYAVNWRFVQEDYAYEAIFVAPSPLQHFWSLAIEAQFYLFFPLLVAGLVRIGGGRGGLTFALVALALGSVGLSFAFPLTDDGINRIYYGSDTRFAEIVFGALLAVALQSRALSGTWSTVAGIGGLVVLVSAWVGVDLSDDALYRGGFAVYGLASTCVVAAAVASGGPVRRLLSPGWLQWIGRISYGAYVFHWPIFLVVDEARTGLSPALLLALRMALTLGVADLSHRFLERPVRTRGTAASRAFGWLVAPAVAGAAVMALWIAPAPAGEVLGRLWHGARPVAGDTRNEGAYRFAFYGDSVSYSIIAGVRGWAEARDEVELVQGATHFGCGVVENGLRAAVNGPFRPIPEKCHDLGSKWVDGIADHGVDLAIVLTGSWDVRNLKMRRGAPVIAIGGRRVDELVAEGLRANMRALADSGVGVIWLTLPHLGENPKVSERGRQAWQAAMRPERVDRFNELLRREARAFPQITVVDLERWVAEWPGGEFDTALRSDTIHFTEEGAARLSEELLAPEILRMRQEATADPDASQEAPR